MLNIIVYVHFVLLLFFTNNLIVNAEKSMSNQYKGYQKTALNKINDIRRKYLSKDLKLRSDLQNSSQEYANYLARLDRGLHAGSAENLLDCARDAVAYENTSVNVSDERRCGEILAIEFNHGNTRVNACNLDTMIGMWETKRIYLNESQSSIFGQLTW